MTGALNEISFWAAGIRDITKGFILFAFHLILINQYRCRAQVHAASSAVLTPAQYARQNMLTRKNSAVNTVSFKVNESQPPPVSRQRFEG